MPSQKERRQQKPPLGSFVCLCYLGWTICPAGIAYPFERRTGNGAELASRVNPIPQDLVAVLDT
jgi:hypothetical protein